MQLNLTKNDISFCTKAFLAIISQQVILQNTFFIGDLFKQMKLAIATLQAAMKISPLKSLEDR